MFALTRKRKIAILVIVDCLLIVLANFLAYLFMKPFVPITERFVMVSAGLSVGLFAFLLELIGTLTYEK